MKNDKLNIWILGAGRFGRKAADVLRKTFPHANITIVDRNDNALESLKNIANRTIREDGIVFLTKNLKNPDHPDWIVPTIPIHVAFEWMRHHLTNIYRLKLINIPQAVINMLPNPVMGHNNEIYTSIADFICPEDCPGLEHECTHTGEPRPIQLHEFLASIQYKDHRSIVIESQQLAPGVGGYSPKALFAALSAVERAHQKPILLSTASQCHGVMHAFEIFRNYNQ